MSYHLAELNLGLMRAPLDDPSMADFAADLPVLNALADRAPGFVWRLVDEAGADATRLRPFGPDVLVNLSVWESVAALREYVYRSEHLESLRRRREWFIHGGLEVPMVLWWVPVGYRPTLEEADARRKLLAGNGPSPEAFTLRESYPAPVAAVTGATH